MGLDSAATRVPLVGRVLLRADAAARAAYAALQRDPGFGAPFRWDAAGEQSYDGLLLPGGHRGGCASTSRAPVLQQLTVAFFRADKPVAAVCHGVLLAARSIDPATGHSALYGRRTTALTWQLGGRPGESVA